MIIGCTGLIGSGKDTIADYLITFHGFRKLSFAGALKDAVAAVFGWDREMLEGTTTRSREWRETVDPWWSERLNIPHLTPRWALQYWGTEVCRQGFHQDIWVASLENRLRNCPDNVVITDARFSNELGAIKRAGGTTLRVHRGAEPEWYHLAVIVNTGETNMKWSTAKSMLDSYNIHPSEWSSVGLEYDHHVYNDSTIDALHTSINEIVNQESSRQSATSLNVA